MYACVRARVRAYVWCASSCVRARTYAQARVGEGGGGDSRFYAVFMLLEVLPTLHFLYIYFPEDC